MSRPCRRVAVAIAVGLAAVAGPARPAAAHTVTGVAPTNYRSEVMSVTPAVPGIEVRLLDLGRRIQARNRTEEDLVVLGYEGEPYLRVGPAGLFENRHSPSLYRNRPPTPGTTATTVPDVADSAASPNWVRVGGGDTARWADQRTRWEGRDPPAVTALPHRTHLVVPRWQVDLRHGTRPVAVTGRITWVPPPAALPWALGALALSIVTAAASRSRHWGPLLAAALAAVVALDVAHSVGNATVDGATPLAAVGRLLAGGFASVVAWGLALPGIGRLQEGRGTGLSFAGAVGFVMFFFSGVSDAVVLARSQVHFAYPPVLARVAVSTALGIGLGLVVASAVLLRRYVVPPGEADDAS